MPANPSVLSALSEELRSIPLPDGIRWLNDDSPTCALGYGGSANPGYTATFVSWLTHITPPTGPNGQGTQLFAKRVSFPIWLANPSRSLDAKRALANLVTAKALEFQAELLAGTASEVLDGGTLP